MNQKMASRATSSSTSTLTSNRQQQHDYDDFYHDDDYDKNYPYELEGLLRLEQTYYPQQPMPKSSPLRIHEDSSNRSRLYQWCTNILQFLKIPNEQQSIMLWTIGYFVDGYMSLILQNSQQNDDDTSSSFQRKSSFLYQLVMATSLNLVIKLHCAGKEGDPTESPSTKFLVYLPLFLKGKAISVEQMSHMEMLLLRQYTFRVHPPTPICFIRDILQHCCGRKSSEEGSPSTAINAIEEHAIDLSMMWLEQCYEQVHCDNDDNDNGDDEEEQNSTLSSLPSPSRLALACVMNAVYYYYNSEGTNTSSMVENHGNDAEDDTNPAIQHDNDVDETVFIQRQDGDGHHYQQERDNERRAIVVIPASSPSVVTSLPHLSSHHHRCTNTNNNNDCNCHSQTAQEVQAAVSNQLKDEQQAQLLQEKLEEMLPFFIKVQKTNNDNQEELNQLRTQLWNMYWSNMKQQGNDSNRLVVRRASQNVSASSSATSSTASSTTTGGGSTRSYHSST